MGYADQCNMHQARDISYHSKGVVSTTATVSEHDPVNHPARYSTHPSGIECIEIAGKLDFLIGNAFKYLWRAGDKDPRKRIEDLHKAAWYIERAAKMQFRVRPRWVSRREIGLLVRLAYLKETDRRKAEGLLLLAEAACCRSRIERAMKLGTAVGIVQKMVEG